MKLESIKLADIQLLNNLTANISYFIVNKKYNLNLSHNFFLEE